MRETTFLAKNEVLAESETSFQISGMQDIETLPRASRTDPIFVRLPFVVQDQNGEESTLSLVVSIFDLRSVEWELRDFRDRYERELRRPPV